MIFIKIKENKGKRNKREESRKGERSLTLKWNHWRVKNKNVPQHNCK